LSAATDNGDNIRRQAAKTARRRSGFDRFVTGKFVMKGLEK
jgi:hypothetical protein